MKISYAITVYNEAKELKRLLSFIFMHKRSEDEVVILQDCHGFETVLGDREVYKVIEEFKGKCKWLAQEFNEDFADWKNRLNGACTGDYIFQIDADECPNENMMKYLPALLEQNPNVDLYLVSRENTVEGLTQEDIDKWHWAISTSTSGKQLINWPDWQTRIYKKGLQWEGKVHERIIGYKKYAKVPTMLFLTHDKGIQKQREQNAYYNQILRNGK